MIHWLGTKVKFGNGDETQLQSDTQTRLRVSAPGLWESPPSRLASLVAPVFRMPELQKATIMQNLTESTSRLIEGVVVMEVHSHAGCILMTRIVVDAGRLVLLPEPLMMVSTQNRRMVNCLS